MEFLATNRIFSQSCISSLVLSPSNICDDMFDVDDTVCGGDTILHNKRQQSDVIPDTLETDGVNEMFFVVTVDVSFILRRQCPVP
jgi:hypothetical protein